VDCAFPTLRVRAVGDDSDPAGVVHDHCVGCHMCNLESVYTYEGTHNIHTLVLGAHLTGMQAFVGTRPAGSRNDEGEERRRAWKKRRTPAVAK